MAKEIHIGAGEFKAHCLRLMDDVQKSRRPVVITKRGKPVAKLVPCEEEAPQLYGFLKGSVKIHDDIVKTVDVKWEADE
jgi:prevent-host-death family protein